MSQIIEDYNAAPLGLYIDKENELLPIFSIEINAVIYGKFAKVQLIHNYYNPYDEYLDTSFKFPTGLYQVFDGIEVEFDNKKIKGVVGLKKEIRKNYVSKLSEGQTVIKAEEFCPTSARIKDNTLVTNIGNIPPHKKIKVIFSFLQTLNISLNKLYKFVLPLVLSPKYIPSENTYILLKDYISKENLNSNKFNSSINMGKIKFIQNKNDNNLKYYYNIDITINSGLKIDKIETRMKDNKVIIKRINDNIYKVSLDPSELHIPNEDFILEYEINQEYLKQPLFLLELLPKFINDYFFYYYFNPTKLIDEKEIKNELNEDLKGNFLLLIDCSGSMYGNKINMVIQSLIYFLKSLKENGSKFNIICFGDVCHSIFKRNKLVNDENVNEALNLVLEFSAYMGGSNIKKVLEYIKEELIEIYLLNRIFIITDGEDYLFNDCFNLIKDISHNPNFDCKIYSLGIGNGCRESSIKDIATNGDGEYELAKNEEDVPDKIIYLLDSSIHFCLDNFDFKLKNNNDKILQECKWSRKLNTNIEFYAFLTDKNFLKENSLICSFYFNKRKYIYEKKIELNETLSSDILHKLFLKSYIILQIQENKNKSRELSIKYQILSEETAFYCLLQENNFSNEELLNKKYKEIENIPPIDFLAKFGVKTLGGDFLELDYNGSYTIEDIKDQIKNKTSRPKEEQRLVFGGKLLEDNKTLNDYKIPFYGILNLVLRMKGGSPRITIKILYDDEEKFSYIYEDSNLFQPIRELFKKACLKLEINPDIDKYDFYCNEKILLKDDFDTTVYDKYYCQQNGFFKIYNKRKSKVSKEDNIIIKQKLNGLWEINDSSLSLLYFSREKWEEFSNYNKNYIKEIFNKDISEEAVFNLIILVDIIKICNGRKRFKYIIKKAINGLNKKYHEINEERIYIFNEKINYNNFQKKKN